MITPWPFEVDNPLTHFCWQHGDGPHSLDSLIKGFFLLVGPKLGWSLDSLGCFKATD